MKQVTLPHPDDPGYEDAFHAFRADGLGSSDIAVALGLSRFGTPYALFLEKTGLLPRPDLSDREDVLFGHLLEDEISKEWARRAGRKVRNVNQGWIHDEYDWARCNVDRRIVAIDDDLGPGILEIKTTNAFMAGEWGPTEKLPEGVTELRPTGPSEDGLVPLYYEVQVQHQLMISGYKWGVLAVLIGGQQLRWYLIFRNEEIISNLILLCGDFWTKIQHNIEPDPDWEHKTTLALLSRRFPGTDGSEVELDQTVLHWHEVRVDSLAWVNSQQKAADAAKARILYAMGDAAIGKLPDGTWYERKQTKAGYIQLTHKKPKASKKDEELKQAA